MKICSYCGARYGDEFEVCPVDNQPLIQQGISQPNPEAKESTFGKVSFAISVAVGVLMVALFIVAGFLHSRRSYASHGYPGQTLVGIVAIGLLATDVVAFGLGIAALVEPGKKRLMGTLGLVFSAMTILGTVGLIIFGLMYASRNG